MYRMNMIKVGSYIYICIYIYIIFVWYETCMVAPYIYNDTWGDIGLCDNIFNF